MYEYVSIDLQSMLPQKKGDVSTQLEKVDPNPGSFRETFSQCVMQHLQLDFAHAYNIFYSVIYSC